MCHKPQHIKQETVWLWMISKGQELPLNNKYHTSTGAITWNQLIYTHQDDSHN